MARRRVDAGLPAAVTTLGGTGVLDERGWRFAVWLYPELRLATIVLNDVVEHRTALDSAGHFAFAPRWLPDRIRGVLEREVVGRLEALAPRL